MRLILITMFLIASVSGGAQANQTIKLEAIDMTRQMWLGDANGADSYVAFRGQIDLPAESSIEIRTLGASWYVVWLDSEYLTEGPARYPITHPQYQSNQLKLGAGKHIIAVQVHHEGVSTRILDNIPPFLICQAYSGDKQLTLNWKCAKLGGYAPQFKRLNPQFAWIEWCDTRAIPADWRERDFDSSSWTAPAIVNRGIGKPEPLSTANVRQFIHQPTPIAKGLLFEAYGYEQDNIAARFFLRNLESKPDMAQGIWRRYDLGRVRLMRPRFTLDLPSGSIVEFAYNEYLSNGRVSPWITLSAGDSCSLDHYVARGGKQEFFPLTPRGGRFVEIHIILPAGHKPSEIKNCFIKEEFLERGYYDKPEGSFHSGDKLLDNIWMVGIETHRACSEDALIDNPTRERGQWAGDVVSVGMDIAAVGYSDLRLCRRALVQCAQCARADGLISGLCPGGGAFLSTYSAQWISACVHYWELTGDKTILKELFAPAERNIAAFENAMTNDGLTDALGWGFVDWGYIRNPGPSDIALDLHYLGGLRDMVRWCNALSKFDRAYYYNSLAKKLESIIEKWFKAQSPNGKPNWEAIGYHRAVLGLSLGFLVDNKFDGIAYIKKHMLSCFPNNPDALRLTDPGANNPMLITPYFAHYAMPILIENGEMDFVLAQYRKCWGWAMEEDRTTWLEVFDIRWSHCHQWAGAPTWQLSNYALGLKARYDLGQRHYILDLHPGSLKSIQGSLPLTGGKGAISIKWERKTDGIHYTLRTPEPIYLHAPSISKKPVCIDGNYTAIL